MRRMFMGPFSHWAEKFERLEREFEESEKELEKEKKK